MKSKRLWFGRSELCPSDVEVGKYKRYWDADTGFSVPIVEDFCYEGFKKATGIELNPGEVKPFRLVLDR